MTDSTTTPDRPMHAIVQTPDGYTAHLGLLEDCARPECVAAATLAREQQEHEEHRQQLAAALGREDPTTPWDALIRRTGLVLAGRHRAVDLAREVEVDRDRLAAELAAAKHRADNAEAALGRVRAQCADWAGPAASRTRDGRVRDEVAHTCADIIQRAAALDGDQSAAADGPRWTVFGRCIGCGHVTARHDTEGRVLCQRCEDRGEIPEHDQGAGPAAPCFHAAWDTHGGARQCADCHEWLDPQAPAVGDWARNAADQLLNAASAIRDAAAALTDPS